MSQYKFWKDELKSLEKRYSDSYVVVNVPLIRASFDEAQEFRAIVEQDLESGNTDFIVDLSTCEFLDSTFVGAMVVMSKKIKELNGNLLLVNSGEFSEMKFLITETLTIFQIFNSMEEAVSSLVEPKQETALVINS